jgi:N-methylhydantoinase A
MKGSLMAQVRWLVAVDIGGTFTDAVTFGPDGELLVAKVPSTPEDPAMAFERALEELVATGLDLSATDLIFHGTTVATNAMLNDQLARVVLLTTEGFRDVLSYRNGTRPKVYDLEQPRPSQLVPRRDRLEVRERLSSQGDEVVPLSKEEIERAVQAVAEINPDAVAVSFLFSYLDDDHERMVADAITARFPDLPVTRSSAIAREFREYPRTATAVVNAGLRPIVGKYLLRMQSTLEDWAVPGPLLIMQSNGGCVPASRANEEAHRLLLSGPAAGVAGTVALGLEYGIDHLVSLDMGGTSLDVCLIQDGTPPVTSTQVVGSHAILCPSVDIVTIGAGGGSIAEVDAAGRLAVGPRSAGATPGPAAYGRGGELPTVTDAHVVLGTLPTDISLASGLRLDAEAAHQAVTRLAEQLELSPEETADGIVRVAVAHMSLALRRVSVERGLDPEGYTLVSFGGAGPLHSGLLLRELGFRSLLVPRHPGLFAASGLVSTNLRIDEGRTVLEMLRAATLAELAAWLTTMARDMTERLVSDGIARRGVRIVASADCRFVGQGFDLNVPLAGLGLKGLAGIAKRFNELHLRTYGHTDPDGQVEIVTLRLSAFGALPGTATTTIPRAQRAVPDVALIATTKARLPGSKRVRLLRVYDREKLRAGHRIDGPAIIHEVDATTLLLDGQSARVDTRASMWIEEKQ